MRTLGLLAVAGCLALVGAGCDSDAKASDHDRTLVVLAASSLTGTFTDLAAQFEAEHPGVDVKLVFDSSATLARMADEGAPGDVLATADQRTMDDAKAAGGIQGDPREFADNVLVLAVPRDNPATVDDIRDLNRPDVDYLTCVTTAPCGSAAQTVLRMSGIHRRPVSEEVDVKAVLAKLAAGEADAGLVYATDVDASKGSVSGISVPGAADHPNTYWVAVTDGAREVSLARAWVGFLTSDEAQGVLRAAGFGTGG